MVRVFFKALKGYEDISLSEFDKLLHEGYISRTNNFGWFCNTRSIYSNKLWE